MTKHYDAVVIGAGHNGLVTAAYLARAGKRVTVLERRDVVGGAAVTQEFHPGFKVDVGAHRIGGFHPTVTKDLALAQNGVRLVPTDPVVFAPLKDGRHLLLWRDPEATIEAIRSFSLADADRWSDFNARIAGITKFLRAVYATTPPQLPEAGPQDLWNMLKLGRGLRRLGRREMTEAMRLLPMSVADLLDEWFETDVLKGVLGASGITGVFQGPMAAGTAFVMLHHHVWSDDHVLRGSQLVVGGVGKLTAALAQVATQHGAEVMTGRDVEEIVVENGHVVGVALAGGDLIRAKRVISNADPKRTLLGLMDAAHLDPTFLGKVRNIRYKGACAKVHLALSELPNFSCLPGSGPHLNGVISVSPSLTYLERAYDDAKYGRISREPYLELSIPSLTDPGLAPEGMHVMTIFMQYAPYQLRDGEWNDSKRAELGDLAIDTLAEYAPNLPAAVLHREVYTPADLESVFGLTEGNIYHGELTLDQLFFMRPVAGWSAYRTPICGLYLCGAGVHPGGGVTGAPGYNAAREVLRDFKKKQ